LASSLLLVNRARFDVKVINPLVTDAYRKMYIRKTKNDRIDAEVVARVILLGDYHETPVAEETTLSLRQLCRFIDYLKFKPVVI